MIESPWFKVKAEYNSKGPPIENRTMALIDALETER